MDLFADLRQGWIEFRSRPWVSAVAVTTLALGIAGSTTMFTMLSAASKLMVPPGIDPARVGRVVWLQYDQDGSRGPLAAEEYAQLKATRAFEQLSASTDQTMVFGGSGGPSTSVRRVSPDYFATFGWKPTAGRLFTSEDSRAGSAPVAIVREGARVRLSGADLGKVVRLGAGSYTIVGILPDRCWFMAPNWPDLWVPLEIGADGVPTARSVTVTARLRSTVPTDIDRVQARIRAIGEHLRQSQAAFAGAGRRLRLVTLKEDVGKRFGFGLVGLLGPALVVLLIACGNVANLLLARAARREQEMAVRAALGAGRFRLIRERLAESAWLAGMGGAVGLALAVAAVFVLKAWIGSFEETRGAADGIRLDRGALLFALGMTAVVPLLFGLVPAVAASRPSLTQALHHVPGQRRARRGPYGWRDILVIVEIGLAVVLVVASIMFTRFFGAIGNVEWGFDPTKVLAVDLSFEDSVPRDVAGRTASDIADAVRHIPGVRSVSLGHTPGLAVGSVAQRAASEGRAIEFERCATPTGAIATAVGPQYFATLGLPVRRGRPILDTDTAGAPPVAVISQTHADRCWPGLDPIGRRVRRGAGGAWMTVVGVVPDTMVAKVLGDTPQAIYMPYAQAAAEPRERQARVVGAAPGRLLLRADNPVALIPAVRAAVRRVDPTQPLDSVWRADEPLRRLTSGAPILVGPMGGFGLLALALGALGVFSVMSYMVAERTREFGIRIALGSSRGEVLRLVLQQAAVIVTVGTAISFGGTLAMTRVGFREMGDMALGDPVLWVSVCVLLAGVAVGASLLPAVRAMRVEPIVALRAE